MRDLPDLHHTTGTLLMPSMSSGYEDSLFCSGKPYGWRGGGLSARQVKNILWNRARQTVVSWDPHFLQTITQRIVLVEFLEGRLCVADIWAEICIYMTDGWTEIGIRAALLLWTKSGLCGILWTSKVFFSSQNYTKSNINAPVECYTLCGATVSNLCSWSAAAGLMSRVRGERSRHSESASGLRDLRVTCAHKAMLLDSMGQMVGICCQGCWS